MFHLAVVTPEQAIFEDDVYAVIAPGKEGFFEILMNHAPIIAALKTGNVVITTKDKTKISYRISGGFLEMSKNQCVLLADSLANNP